MRISGKILAFALLAFAMLNAPITAQEELQNWHHQGAKSEFPNGIRSDEWYMKASAGKPQTIIVAILDSGVDINHPDLKDNIWVNEDEVPGNKKDDDGNGYVDDVNGWNFIGGPDGRNVYQESLEITRLYGSQKAKWENVDVSKLSGRKKKEYEEFLKMEEIVLSKRESAENQVAQVGEMKQIIVSALTAAQKELNGDTLDVARLEQSTNEEVLIAAKIIRNVEEQGVPVESIEWLLEVVDEQFREQLSAHEKVLKYTYNTEFDSRLIVGDTYSDFDNRIYGNNDVGGEFAVHGTHVAGIVGAVRDNELGMNGVSDHVALMSVKIVPDGDERDKDVANAIYYAVDNGALVINMSFGKGYSPEKYLVDKAMKYAAKHDVVLVLGAGNEGSDIDADPKYPNDTYQKKCLFGPKNVPTLISVGALAPEGGEHSIAEFSNYGKKEVDVFAPGVYIYSTTPDSTYEYLSGTSMASPVVAGAVALIRSRYPDLSAKQVKEIIMSSTRKIEGDVVQPGTFETVSASSLSVTGGIIDVVSAMKLASETRGKAKKKNRVPAALSLQSAEKV